MKCLECGADIYEGVKKCPYCKTPTQGSDEGKFKNYDIKYTINSAEELKAISRSEAGEVKKDSFSSRMKRKKIYDEFAATPVPEPKLFDAQEKAREIALYTMRDKVVQQSIALELNKMYDSFGL